MPAPTSSSPISRNRTRSVTVERVQIADGAPSVGILILAGGEATRLPGKLSLAAGDLPLVARVYRNFAQPQRELFIACNAGFAPALDALLPAPAVIDRWPRRGPLGGMLTAFPRMRSRFVFAVAADAPFVTSDVLARLLAARRPGDEALVPERLACGERMREPLATLYDRLAFVRAGFPVLRSGRGSLHAVLERLETRFVRVAGDETFTNVNTPADYAALQARLGADEA